MKKILMMIFVFCLTLTFFGCNTFKSVADSFKTTHTHEQKKEVSEETTENLNYKVVDTTTEKSDNGENAENNKSTVKEKITKKNNKKESDDEDEPEYPYVNVNDGDTTKYEWPKEGLAAEIPELKSGTMKKPFISKSTFSVYYAEVVPEEFDEYLGTLKKKGFKIDDTIDEYVYIANNGKIEVEFFYDTSKLGNNTLSLVARYL